MRFYFHVIEGAEEIRDPEGTDLPDMDAAKREAMTIAAELCAEFPGRFGDHAILEVFSGTGQRLFTVPISDSRLVLF